MPITGPRRTSTLRFIAPFITPLVTMRPSLGVRGRACGGRQALALELSNVGDDRPPVRRRDRPAIPRHQPFPVRDHVEDLTVGIVANVLLMEGGGGNVAALEQDPLP